MFDTQASKKHIWIEMKVPSQEVIIRVCADVSNKRHYKLNKWI